MTRQVKGEYDVFIGVEDRLKRGIRARSMAQAGTMCEAKIPSNSVLVQEFSSKLNHKTAATPMLFRSYITRRPSARN